MKTVLVIEDNEQNLYLTRFMLEQQGYRVESALDGPAGIAAALRLQPDMILLDIQLPGMDGHEVARRLRSHPALDRTPIVAVTSYAMAGDRERILKAGCTGYIEKPINPDTFINDISLHFSRPQKVEGPVQILVVDDIEVNCYFLETVFRSHGWTTVAACNGAEALALAAKSTPTLVIADILMPVMDGFTLCRKWRADARLADVPFVFYTATYTGQDDERLGLSLGADLFLIKPLEPDALLGKLRELLVSHRDGLLRRNPSTAGVESSHLMQYNAALVRKLEDKMRQLEVLNRDLEQRVVKRTSQLEAAQQELEGLSLVGTWAAEREPSPRIVWSALTHALFGLAPGSFDGRLETFISYIHPADVETFRSASEESWGRGRPLDVVLRIATPEGELRWIHLQARLEPGRNGKPITLRGIVRDVTEQRRLEDQLRQAQKMEAIGQLAGGVAHDFNNLLTVIQGYASLILADDGLSRDTDESAREIVGAVDRAAALTRQLLTFSRKQSLQLKPLDLNRVVNEMTRMLRRVVGERIVLREQLEPQLPGALADTGMIEQVIMNLVVNARDAMPAGGDLWLKTQVTVFDEAAAIQSSPAREGTFLCLTVADTGTGIAEDDLPHIFEPFFTTKEVGQGSGLGLATVYGIIQQHRGWITVSTEAGRGTTFHVYLPTTPDAVVEHPATTAASPKGGGETILVVEDEGAVRDLVREILIRQGYQVLVAENTPDALDVWHSNNKQIDLLLTDLVMPGQLSGRDLAVLLRAERPELRIIFTSGYSPEAKAIELDAIPGAYFLGKPYPPAKLASLVRQCLDQGK